jgi:hypothetical protein
VPVAGGEGGIAVTEYDSALEALLNSTEAMVTAAQIAPVLHMNPGVIVKYAKDGTWIQKNMGKFIISGDRVKFFRRDFLQKCGFIPADPPERTTTQALDDLREELHDIGLILLSQMSSERIKVLEQLKENEKTAGAATPTD